MRPDTPPAPVSNSPSPTAIPGAGPSIAPEPPAATRTDARPARRPSLLRPPDATSSAGDAGAGADLPDPLPTRWNRPSATPGRPASCRARGSPTPTSSPSRTAGGSASPTGTATARATRSATTIPTRRAACSTRSTRTSSRAITRSSGSTRSSTSPPLAFTFSGVRQIPTATTPFESTAQPVPGRLLRPAQPVLLPATSSSWRSTCSTATPRSSRPTGRSSSRRSSTSTTWPSRSWAIVSPNVLQGHRRAPATFLALQEWFVETKIADLSPDYDFVSVRVGIAAVHQRLPRLPLQRHQPRRPPLRHPQLQPRPVQRRLLPPVGEGHQQLLNTFNDRHQNLVIANYYRQDFLFPGYTAQVSLHYNHDQPTSSSTRTASWSGPTRSASSSRTRSTSSTSAGPATATSAASTSRTSSTGRSATTASIPLANQAADDQRADGRDRGLSYDRDWVRFRTSFFYASGDSNPNNSHATGFDSILDRPELRRRPVQLLATASRSRCSASTWSTASAWCPTCVRARSRGRPTSSTPACSCPTSASTST